MLKSIQLQIITAGIIGLIIGVGLIYFVFPRVVPQYVLHYRLVEIPHFKVGVEMDKTQYQVGEEILTRPFLINKDKQPNVEEWIEGYTFILDQPGRYKIVAWAEFIFDPAQDGRYPFRIYSFEPIWIEIYAPMGGSPLLP